MQINNEKYMTSDYMTSDFKGRYPWVINQVVSIHIENIRSDFKDILRPMGHQIKLYTIRNEYMRSHFKKQFNPIKHQRISK